MKKKINKNYPFKGWLKFLLVMKFSTLFLCLFVMQTSASVFSQSKFTCEFKDQTILNILKDIENKSDYRFFFQHEQVDVDRQISLAVSNKTAEEVLDLLFKDGTIKYQILDNNIILLTRGNTVTYNPVFQQKTLTGVVTDSTGNPIAGVSVQIQGTIKGTLTDVNGKYSLPGIPENARLIFSFVGMKTREVIYQGQSILNVTLSEDITDIDEVMVVAYGTAKKSTFTGSTTMVRSEKLEKISGSGFAETLQGMSAGVNVVNNEGNPGGDTRIRIRGIGSMEASSDPLYVVDGMPFDGKLTSIASDDIESMTVLKDAAASSIYGSRAANGVVMITTKKGKSAKPTINFKAAWGTSDLSVKNPTKANPYEQLTNTWEGIYNDYYYKYGQTDAAARTEASDRVLGRLLKAVENSQGEVTYVSPFRHINEYYVLEDGTVNPNLQLIWDKSDYDWNSAVYSYKLRQDYSLDVSGMTSDLKTNYYFSASYLDDNGYGLAQYFKRYGFRSNITTEVTDWLQMGANLAYSNSRQNNSGFIRALVFSSSMSSPYLRNKDNTDWEYSKKTGHRMLDYGAYANDFFGMHPLDNRGDYFDNPDDASFSNILAGMISARYFAEFKLPLHLKFRTNISLDDNTVRNFDYSSAVHGADQLQPYGITVKTSGGSASRQGNKTNSITWNNLLKYDARLGDHSVNAMVGHELYSYRNYYDYCYGEGILQLDQYEVASTTSNWSVSSYKDKYALLSFLGKVDYGFRDKYYLSLSYRLDGSSRFAEKNRWGSFISGGASWRISKERFLKDVSWLDNLSLRTSYGTTGNDNVNNLYAYQATYNDDNMYGMAGLKPATIANPKLKWEKNEQFNVAADFSIFNRISGTLEYYKRKSKDLLYYKHSPLSSQVGIADGYYTNLGDIQNYGLEVTLNASLVNANKFKWDIDANWSSLKNEITYLPSGEYTWSERTATYKMAEGHSRYEFFMPSNAGVDPETGNALFWIKNEGGEWIKTSDWSEVTIDDYKWQGSALPKGFGAVTNTLQYGNLDMSFMFYYSYGSYMYDYVYMERVTLRGGVGVIQNLVHDRWRKPGDDAYLPRWSDDDFASTRRATNFWLFKNNYVRLRNLNIGYTLPSNITKKAGISRLRLYLSGDNLMTFGSAKKRYSDPETGITGNNYNGNSVTDNGYPASRRVYMGGVQVSF